MLAIPTRSQAEAPGHSSPPSRECRGMAPTRNLEDGTPEVGELNPIAQFCFAMEIRVSARLISGSKDEPQGWKKRGKC